jgi:hypothetical protein
MQTVTSKLMRFVQDPLLLRVLFWSLVILIYEAMELPWRWRRFRTRLS